MKITEAITYLKRLQETAISKNERKAAERFISVLDDVRKKTLTSEQVNSLEDHLETLKTKLKSSEKKFIGKRSCTFEKFLREQLNLIPKGYHAAMGITLGLSFGTGIGLTIGTSFLGATGTSIGLSMGAGIGMLVGMIIGSRKDAEIKKQGNTLDVKAKF